MDAIFQECLNEIRINADNLKNLSCYTFSDFIYQNKKYPIEMLANDYANVSLQHEIGSYDDIYNYYLDELRIGQMSIMRAIEQKKAADIQLKLEYIKQCNINLLCSIGLDNSYYVPVNVRKLIQGLVR
jgi:hypothetical protein